MTRVSVCCSPKLEEVCYSSSCQDSVSETIRCLLGARKLRVLEITPRNMVLSPDQLHTLGLLPLTELRLNSYMYNQQPAINRASQSHLDNEGVRALVDSICHRVNARAGTLQQGPLLTSLALFLGLSWARFLSKLLWQTAVGVFHSAGLMTLVCHSVHVHVHIASAVAHYMTEKSTWWLPLPLVHPYLMVCNALLARELPLAFLQSSK